MKKLDAIRVIVKQLSRGSALPINSTNLENVIAEMEKLNSSEKASLISSGPSTVGTLLHDPAGILHAVMSIEDSPIPKKGARKSRHRARPLGLIKTSIGGRNQIEVIDILESISRDATAVSHPIVRLAIDRWQRIIRSSRYLRQSSVHNPNDAIKDLEFRLRGRSVVIAERNLKAVSAALLAATRRNSLTREEALAFLAEDLGIYSNSTYLRIAWDRLERKHIDEKDECPERIKKIVSFLNDVPISPHCGIGSSADNRQSVDTSISVLDVEEFLLTEGKRFVYQEDSVRTQRPSWRTFRNAYLSWHVGKKVATVNQYLKRSKKHEAKREEHDHFVFGASKETSLFSLVYESLSSPLVNYCPILVDPDLDRMDLSDLIEEARTKQSS